MALKHGLTSRATKLSSSLIMAYPAYTGWLMETLTRRLRCICTTITTVVTTPYVSSRATSAPNTPPTIATLQLASEQESILGSVVGIIRRCSRIRQSYFLKFVNIVTTATRNVRKNEHNSHITFNADGRFSKSFYINEYKFL